MASAVPSSSSQSLTSVEAPSKSRRPLVLVIDPDESTRSVLEVAMARDGFEVWSAASARDGLTLLSGRTPDAIVLESDLGGEEGFSFVAQLRGDERLAQVPVLLLAQADDQNVEALADVVGADDFIQKPAFARDVASLVRVELARAAGGPLRFDAKTLPPVQLLRALLTCPRSGRLLLVDGRAEVRFRTGKVLDARFDGKGGTLDTLVRALALTGGAYTLELTPMDGFAEFQCTLREVVELVVPRLQKWERVLQRSLPLETRLTVDFQRLASALKAMPDEVNRVVQLFDGFRTVEQALIDSPIQESLTLEVATRLYLMGVLTPAKGAEAELIFPRPMPRLFEPRAAEAEELMQQLFAGTAEIRAEEVGPVEDPDWFAPTPARAELEVSDPNGGWTTAPVPAALAEGLSPELSKQLDAFQTPMRVEAPQVSPEVAAAQKFVKDAAPEPQQTALESALQGATTVDEDFERELARFQAQAKGRQARIETPWMTPVVQVPEQAPSTVASAPTVEVSPDAALVTEQAAGAPVRQAAQAPATGAGAAVVQTAAAQTREASHAGATAAAVVRSVEVVPDAAEAAFFQAEAPAAIDDEVVPEQKPARRRWPFVVGAVALAAVALVIEARREAAPEAAPVPAVVVPAAVAAAPEAVADVEAPVLLEVDGEAVEAAPEELEAAPEPAPVDVSENLAEATRLYNQGSYKKSISVLEQVVSDDPKSVLAWNLMGLAKYDALDSAGAHAAAQKVLELDPKNARVQILLATLHFDGGDKAQGRAALEKYLELAPNGPEVAEVQALLKRHR